jgi:hypothetical protein
MNAEFDDKELKALLQKSRGDMVSGDALEENVMSAVHHIEQERKAIARYRRLGWISLTSACVLILLFSLLSSVSFSISDLGTNPQYLIAILVVGSIVTFLIDNLSGNDEPSKNMKINQLSH